MNSTSAGRRTVIFSCCSDPLNDRYAKSDFSADLLRETSADTVIYEANDSDPLMTVAELCRNAGISVFDPAGNDLCAETERLDRCRYMKTEDWIELVRGYDVLSVSLLDTALSRDVFDESVLHLRYGFGRLFDWCMNNGVQVELIGTPAFSPDAQKDALRDHKWPEHIRKLADNEVFRERNADFFRNLSEKYEGKKILHIGNRYYTDGIMPVSYGIDTYLMVYDQTGAYSLQDEKDTVNTFTIQTESAEEQCVSALCQRKIKECEDDSETYGYAVLGPVICAYLSGLRKELRQYAYDSILFVSRDGWIVREMYEKYIRKDTGIPSIYFYTSRHAAFLAAAEQVSPGYIAGCASRMSPEEMMRQFYGLSDADILPWSNTYADRADYIRRHIGAIKTRSSVSRQNMLKYCRDIGLRENGRYLFSDFVAAGTCQAFLSRVLPFDLRGYYFGLTHTEDSFSENIRACFNDAHQEILRRYVDLEFYMTSDMPSVRDYDDHGQPVFADDGRSQEVLNRIRSVHQGIREFVHDWYAGADTDLSADTAEQCVRTGCFLGQKETLIDDWSGLKISD